MKDGIQFLNEYVKEVLEYYMSQLNEKNYEIVETSLNAFKEMFNVILDINKEKIAFLIPDFIKFIIPLSRHNKPIIRSDCFVCLTLVIDKWPLETKSLIFEITDNAFLQLNFNWKSEDIAEKVAECLANLLQNFTTVEKLPLNVLIYLISFRA